MKKRSGSLSRRKFLQAGALATAAGMTGLRGQARADFNGKTAEGYVKSFGGEGEFHPQNHGTCCEVELTDGVKEVQGTGGS